MNKPKFRMGQEVYVLAVSDGKCTTNGIQYPFIRVSKIRGIVKSYDNGEESQYLYCLGTCHNVAVFEKTNWITEDRICIRAKDIDKMKMESIKF